jgi:hypothetical protein
MIVFEKLGHVFQKARNFFIVIAILFSLPLISIAYVYHLGQKSLHLSSQLVSIQEQAALSHMSRKANGSFMANHTNSDPKYLSKHLESARLLEEELPLLKDLSSHEIFKANSALSNRIKLLEGKGNRIQFLTKEEKNTFYGKQILLQLDHPVELNRKDVDYLLGILDETSPAKEKNLPQLSIQSMKLKKRTSSTNNEVFLLTQLKLIKREYRL